MGLPLVLFLRPSPARLAGMSDASECRACAATPLRQGAAEPFVEPPHALLRRNLRQPPRRRLHLRDVGNVVALIARPPRAAPEARALAVQLFDHVEQLDEAD